MKQLKDFKNFMFLVWKHLGLPPPTPIQYDIADYIQSNVKRSIVEAFRGVGKSYITAAYVVHQLLLNPDKKFLVVSASKARADDFSTFTQRIIMEMPLCKHLVAKEGQRWSKIAFDVAPTKASGSPSVKSIGISGQITGSRADVIISDDVEVANNSMTQMMRERLSENVKEFDAVLKPEGRIIYLGTPQTELSLYNVLVERGYEMRIWTARYPSSDSFEKNYSFRLAPYIVNKLEHDDTIVGKPTDPKRFNEDDLLERELSYGRSGFALQFMLDTRLSDLDRYPLKCSDLMIMSMDTEKAPEGLIYGIMKPISDLPCVGLAGDKFYAPESILGDYVPYDGSVLAIDPSGKGADETAFAVVKMLNGFLYVANVGGLTGGYSKTVMETLAFQAKKHKVNLVIVEENYGGGMFTELFKPHLQNTFPTTIEEVRHSKQKEARILDCLEPIMNQHKLIFDPRVIQQDYDSVQNRPPEQMMRYMLCYQMTRLTRDRGSLKHDDRLDVLAMACQYWVDSMAADAQQNIMDRKAELLDQELDKFINGINTSKHRAKTNTWMAI